MLALDRLESWIFAARYLNPDEFGSFAHHVPITDETDLRALKIAATDPRIIAIDPPQPKLGDNVVLHIVHVPAGRGLQ